MSVILLDMEFMSQLKLEAAIIEDCVFSEWEKYKEQLGIASFTYATNTQFLDFTKRYTFVYWFVKTNYDVTRMH